MKNIIILMVCGLILPGFSVAASKPLFSTGVNAVGTYSDNINIARNNTTEIDDFIFQVNPYLSVRRDSSRLKLNLDYQLQSLFYSDQDQNNEVYHQLKSNLKANIVKDVFFVNASAQYGQSLINSAGKAVLNNLSVTNNRTNVASANINPYGVFRSGRIAKTTVGIDGKVVKYRTNLLNDSEYTRYYIRVESGPNFNKLKWNFNYNKDKSTTDNRPDSDFESYDVGLNLGISRKLAFVAMIGEEDFSYLRAAATEDPQGINWNLGAVWTPGKLTSVEVRFGKRFYGSTGLLKVSSKTRKTESALNYQEDVSVSTITEFERQVFQVIDEFGNPVLDVAGRPSFIDITQPIASSDIFIRKRMSANFALKSAKSRLAFSAYNEKRLYQAANNQERVYGLNGRFDWNFALRTKLRLGATGQIRNFRGSSRQDGFANVRATIERKMRRKLTGSISVQHTRLDSSINANDYNQNMLIIGIDWQL